MGNKKIWVSAIVVVIILILIGGGIYFYKNIYKKNLRAPTSESSPINGFLQEQIDSNLYINNLDRKNCSEIEDDRLKENCVGGIDLIEKAVVARDPSLCFLDNSTDISMSSRNICFKKSNELIQNG